MFEFASPFIDSHSCSSLSITSINCLIRCREFSRQPARVLRLVWSDWADRKRANLWLQWLWCRSDDIVLDLPSSSVVTVCVEDERIWYGPILRRKNFEYELGAIHSAAVIANGKISIKTHWWGLKVALPLTRQSWWALFCVGLQLSSGPFSVVVLQCNEVVLIEEKIEGFIKLLTSVSKADGGSKVVGPWGCLHNTKQNGVVLVEWLTGGLYAYLSSCTKIC